MSAIAQKKEQGYPVQFTGMGGEYFRIWIVNLALTILTLGIYSAWAKVRRKRYFYEHTIVDGDPFEYRGNPVAIFKGRLIGVGILAVIWLAGHFYPLLGLVVMLAAIFVIPWLIVRSFAFNAYNSAFRNIRFHFRGTYGRALKLLVGYGLLTIVTFGLGWFWLKTRMTEFIVRNHYYGTTRFDVPDLKPGFFRIYGHAIGLGVLLGLALFGLTFALSAVMPTGEVDNPVFGVVMSVLVYLGYLFIYAYVRAGINNAMWNQASLGTVRFTCTLKAAKLFWIYTVNIILIVVTLGLFTPWAVVRTLRYRAENLALVATDGLEQFTKAESANVSAAGEEVGEMLDFDFSL
jgi:uncharacterized membrane protein YjgN (DUF898 family)